MDKPYKRVRTDWVGFHSSRSGYISLKTHVRHGYPRQVSHHVCKLIITLCLTSLVPTLNFSKTNRRHPPQPLNLCMDRYLQAHISCINIINRIV